MGKGLQLDKNSEGLHFAFAAGTGVLVFIDLVGRLILEKCKVIEEEKRMNPNFKFVLFASFESRE